MDSNGDYTKVTMDGIQYSGRELLDQYELLLREAYGNRFESEDDQEMDIFLVSMVREALVAIWKGWNENFLSACLLKIKKRI